jgi:proline dehydrogenase
MIFALCRPRGTKTNAFQRVFFPTRLQVSYQSNWAIKAEKGLTDTTEVPVRATELSRSPLARLPTSSVIRSLFLSIFFTSPLLFRPGLAIFSTIAHSNSSFLNPDKNPILRAVIRPVIYDQFCAGTNEAEIQNTSHAIKQLGFSGVVLCYGKEVQFSAESGFHGYAGKTSAIDAEVEEWKEGNLSTLDMTQNGDWLGIKLTGAGLQITQALMNGDSAPRVYVQAMDEICEKAASKGCRIWIDSEQQVFQQSIDRWTFDMMRKYNRGEKALVYNTVQAYLKSARGKVEHQMQTASDEGWRSAIKLVRGAYIAIDARENIHDTKAETDDCYNGIVEDLLRGTGFSVFESNPNLKYDLLCAGHNTQTIRRTAQLADDLAAASKLKVQAEFAQLQGMADNIGCELVQRGEDAINKSKATGLNAFVPKVYKCLTWGSIQECMQYLLRRLVENRGAADRMKEGTAELRKELWRRMTLSR